MLECCSTFQASLALDPLTYLLSDLTGGQNLAMVGKECDKTCAKKHLSNFFIDTFKSFRDDVASLLDSALKFTPI